LKRRKRITVLKRRNVKYVRKDKFADRQINWAKHIPALKNYEIQSVEELSIPGEAPKDFITDKEYRRGFRGRVRYIAKVAAKFYPLESVIEQLLTRMGQCLGLNIAESKLRLLDGQVRFMSRYFLRKGESLIHGAQIYEYSLGKQNYEEIAEKKNESEFFTYESTCGAIKHMFPTEAEGILEDYTKMLVFDAIIGHNDRHPYNWGVIVPTTKSGKLCFSPIYDTARALFWNIPERKIVEMLRNNASFEAYVNRCELPIGWDGEDKLDFFRLTGLIWSSCPNFRGVIESLLDTRKLEDCITVLHSEFTHTLSEERRKLIEKCLRLRNRKLVSAIDEVKIESE
jgi:ribosome biogenesis protein Nip4